MPKSQFAMWNGPIISTFRPIITYMKNFMAVVDQCFVVSSHIVSYLVTVFDHIFITR